MKPVPTDAITYLISEHEQHRQLLAQLPSAPTSYAHLREELITHVQLEERLFYPGLLKIFTLEELVKDAWLEHNQLMALLQEIDNLTVGSPRWETKLKELTSFHLAHMQEEETLLFPRIREYVTAEFLGQLRGPMELLKATTNPNRSLYPECPGSHQI